MDHLCYFFHVLRLIPCHLLQPNILIHIAFPVLCVPLNHIFMRYCVQKIVLEFELNLENFTVAPPFNGERNYTCIGWHSSLE